ncbi:MAG TPA: elongation factor G [Candidatus Cloacimonadota bacterium]|nr:elongation factor G [Candidatus Cloacimonadota bacterium]
MKNYEMNALRNLAFIGSSGAGKTSLIEQMLYLSKMTNRLGKVTDGNTVMDYDQDEIEKGISLMMSIGYADWKNNRINLVDTPGYGDFIGDQIAATTAADTVAVVANATGGFEVGLEKSLEILDGRKVTKAVIINKMDADQADYFKVLETIKDNTGITVAPVLIPMGREANFKGVIDVVKGKAIIDGKIADVPAEFADELEEAKAALMEAVAETDEALLEKFFESMELSEEELVSGLKNALAQSNIIPAFCCSANTGVGVQALMDAIIEYLPSPEAKKAMNVLEDKKDKNLICTPNGDLLAYVFKSVVDPNMGDVAYVRVYSGTLKSGMDIFIPEKDAKDKVSSMYFFQGKNRSDAGELKAGEIGGLVKLKVARGLNSIVAVNSKLSYQKTSVPSPVYWQAIKAANQNDEDKIGQALGKLLAEDPTITSHINLETHEHVLSAMGEQQMTLIQKRLKNRYKVDALLKTPKIPYKETIQGKADTKYRHKKQSGGKGQYGEVYFRVSPTGRGEGYKFVNSIVGGTIPGNFIPAIEKGIQETLEKGIIAGYTVVDICVDCYFGSYHDVDSSEMAFKIASSMCLKDAFTQAKPILLEPIHEIEIIIPTEYMGDVMGDISTRRGKINGMEQQGKKQILKANVPLAELFAYFPALKSLTQGRGMFTQKFSHFEKVPEEIAKVVIEAYKKEEE